MGDHTHSLGTKYVFWVRLFEAGSADEIGNVLVTISATARVDNLRDAIIEKCKLGVAVYKVAVKPTRDGAPLNSNTFLWKVPFELDAEGVRPVYVELPKPEGTGQGIAAFIFAPICCRSASRSCGGSRKVSKRNFGGSQKRSTRHSGSSGSQILHSSLDWD